MNKISKAELNKKQARPDREMLDIWIGPTCANNCIFCTEGGRKTKRRVLSLNKTEELLKDNPKVRQVIFSGGEPTLNKNFIKYVKLAKKYDFPKIVLITNGRKLSSMDYCKDILKAGINEIRISVHGRNAELHDSQTRAKGSFKETVKGLENLKKLKEKFTFITVITVVMNKMNIAFLTDILRWLRNFRIDRATFVVVEAINDGRNNAFKYFEKIVPDYHDIAAAVKKMLDYKIAFSTPFDVIIDSAPFCLMQGYEDFMGQRDVHVGFDPGSSEAKQIKLPDCYGKVKGPACRKCSYFAFCEGVWEEYINKKGWREFRPVM